MTGNRRKLFILVAAATAVLTVLLLAPAGRQLTEEPGAQMVSLGEVIAVERSGQAVEEVESYTVQNRLQEEMQETETLSCEAMPQVTLRLETVSGECMDVNLWQGEDGICYFFLPGYAESAKITLQNTEGGFLYINGKTIRVGDEISDIRWNASYQAEIYLVGTNFNAEKEYGAETESDTETDPDAETATDLRRISGAEGETELTPVQLIFMHSSSLPVLSVNTESGSLEQIHADKAYTEEGTVVWQDEQGTVAYEGAAQAIGGRGNSTWGLAKKPYQLKLYESVDLLGAGEAKTYNLLANGYDETRLRNRIAAELAEALDMANVPQFKMIDLYINGYYYGNYYLTEKIAIDDAAAGDYLIERELEERYETAAQGFTTDQGDCYVVQTPEKATEEQLAAIADWMQEFQDAAQSQDGVNPENGRHYSEYIDVTSFVQKYLVEEISKNYDGGVTSSFFYKKAEGSDEKLYAGPIWDYDVAFGNCNLDKIASDPLGVTKLSNHIYGTTLFANLYQQPDFYAQTVQMYEEKALPYLDGLLDGGIDRMAEESRLSAEMDSIRWEALENRYQYYEDYDNDVRYLKYFIEKRRDFLSDVWLENAVYHNVNFVVEDEIWQILCVEDGELPKREPVPVKDDAVFAGWYMRESVPYDMNKPVYEDITYYALWQELD